MGGTRKRKRYNSLVMLTHLRSNWTWKELGWHHPRAESCSSALKLQLKMESNWSGGAHDKTCLCIAMLALSARRILESHGGDKRKIRKRGKLYETKRNCRKFVGHYLNLSKAIEYSVILNIFDEFLVASLVFFVFYNFTICQVPWISYASPRRSWEAQDSILCLPDPWSSRSGELTNKKSWKSVGECTNL